MIKEFHKRLRAVCQDRNPAGTKKPTGAEPIPVLPVAPSNLYVTEHADREARKVAVHRIRRQFLEPRRREVARRVSIFHEIEEERQHINLKRTPLGHRRSAAETAEGKWHESDWYSRLHEALPIHLGSRAPIFCDSVIISIIGDIRDPSSSRLG